MPIELSTDANGWTVIPAIEDGTGTKYYVNPADGATDNGWSVGSDSNDGLAKTTPFATLLKAADVVAADGNKGHHIILKDGSAFSDHFGIGTGDNLGMSNTSGFSTSDPIIVYTENWDQPGGCTRAKITSWSPLFRSSSASQKSANMAFIGLEYTAAFEKNTDCFGCKSGGEMENFLVEDCYIHDCGMGATLEGIGTGSSKQFDWVMRRCTFYHNWDTTVPTQAIYLAWCNKWQCWECAFVRSGWHPLPAPDGKPRDIFNRAIYAHTETGDDILADRSIFTDGASHVQFRGGGTFTNNLIEHTPMTLVIGGGAGNQPGGAEHDAGSRVIVEDNVMVHSVDIGPGFERGLWLNIENMSADYTTNKFDRNIVADDTRSTEQGSPALDLPSAADGAGRAGVLNNGVHNFTMEGNVFHSIKKQAMFCDFDEGDGTSTISVCNCNNNKFDIYNSGDAIIDQTGTKANSTTFARSGNNYWHSTDGDISGVLVYNGTPKDFAGWKTAAGESDATWGDPAYKDPLRQLTRYYRESLSLSTDRATTAVAWSGGELTVTTSGDHGLAVGTEIELTGLGPSSLNTFHTISGVPTLTTFTITMGDPTVTQQIGAVRNDREAMYALILANNRANWNTAYTAPVINDWIRDGYDMTALEAPTFLMSIP